jgi:uncharacterized protein (DUF1800 family)
MSDPATRTDVARLFGRAAFGATAAILDTWTGREYADVVAGLFPPGPPGSTARLPQGDEAERLTAEHYTTTTNLAQMWWMERMRSTPYPLEERMTLFWHDHFATGYLNQPDTGYLMVQQAALRANALGSFRALANAMTVDGAMLYWLNGIANHKAGVNENYAREFFELFTLGVHPQVYTETDIRESARALTGWTINTGLRQPTFTEARHDLTTKSVLGRTIGGYPAKDPRHATEYTEVTEAALAHDGGRTCSRFLAYKLVLSFGYQPDEANLLNDAVIQDVAAAIRADDTWDLAAGVRTMLLHPGWRYADPAAGRNLVRSPVELLIHAGKVLGQPCSVYGGTTQVNPINLATPKAGQALLYPPSVGGWPNGVGWLSQTTTLGRYEILNTMFTVYRNEQRSYVTPPPASSDIAGWTAFMGLGSLTSDTTLRLREYLESPGTTVELDKQASMFLLLGSSPDWQVL